ncbi:hypothetical protein [Roseobacter sp. HKCCA0434]|uniref:hypothetical protein n=1 Tax=Roseobacter sp. HKCCA0434 TaxID=3079297 RepID=UPI0029058A86|nr:hypothetical protein [Roseobacter sp. HKCCA0434]
MRAGALALILLAGAAAAQEPLRPAPRPCDQMPCLRSLRTLPGTVPNLIGDADDQIEDRGAFDPNAATPYDPEATGPTRDLLLQRLGRDRPRNRIGHY